ncbi:hypothetical protein HYH02_015374 [Chlamydomonas schloesseri]|uniref:Uncharacterized protein n=1 Tax=Chlamydomonas schloesseri TaxID=2026947 RepID=A0A835VPK8_9CHLO|nr:hypothetical protein HYH02_015374 [Chlamydomonas schloesseri]|eukprot:KAG2423025.1 hypothetical protein HYH02_015374 [Chlamydomonas schloesseri]
MCVVSGFKEVRFVRGRAFHSESSTYDDFDNFIQFLRLLCTDMKVLLNSRASASLEDNYKLEGMLSYNGVLKTNNETFLRDLQLTHEWYDRYAEAHPDHAFRVTMEDMFNPEVNGTLVRRLISFLGESPDAYPHVVFNRMPTWSNPAKEASRSGRNSSRSSSNSSRFRSRSNNSSGRRDGSSNNSSSQSALTVQNRPTSTSIKIPAPATADQSYATSSHSSSSSSSGSSSRSSKAVKPKRSRDPWQLRRSAERRAAERRRRRLLELEMARVAAELMTDQEGEEYNEEGCEMEFEEEVEEEDGGWGGQGVEPLEESGLTFSGAGTGV